MCCLLRDTYIEQEQGEGANDRNDRAIRVAVKWYNEHLKKSQNSDVHIQVILMTNDRKNKERAVEDGLTAFTCKYENGIRDVVSEENLLASH